MIEAIIIGFLLGASLGSFINVCAYRIPRRLSVVWGRSFCPSCKRTLRWFELLPVISYVWSRGRCLGCREKISLQYPLIELVSGVIVVLVILLAGLSTETLLLVLFALSMLLVAIIDWQHLLIPNKVLLWSLGLGIVLKAASGNAALGTALLAMILSLGLVLLLQFLGNALLGRQSLGMGDVKLAAFIGFALGLKGLLVSLWLGAVAGLLFAAARQLILRGEVQGESTRHGVRIPFGSFLASSAALLALLETVTQDFISLPHGVPWLSH